MRPLSNLKACAVLVLSYAILLSTLILTPTQAFANPLKAWLPGEGPEPTVPAGATVSLLTIGNPIVVGGNTGIGRITLTAPAPAGGAIVQLSGNIPAATVPPSVTVPAGATVKAFYIKTVPVTSQQSGMVHATFGAVSSSVPLTVRPIGVLSVTFASASVIGGNNATCTVLLERPAAPGSIRVALGSSNASLAAPTVPSILFPAGARSLSFGVRTFSTSITKTVDITATANGISKSGRLTILPRVTNCTYSITPASKQFTAAAGTGSVAVTASNNACSWTATKNTNVSWLTITSGASGSGNGTVNYSVTPNTGSTSRSVVLTIAGKMHTVTQAAPGGCSFSITPSSKQFTSAAGTGSVAVTAGSGCSWTATKVGVISWLTITSGASGSGNGTVNYSVTANTGTSPRTATLTIAGQTYTVTQAGTGTTTCAFSLLPANAIVHAAGENGRLAIDTATGCSWNAVSNVPWITISSGQNGAGAGIVSYTVEPYTGPVDRTGTMTIGGKTFTVGQASRGNNLTLTLSRSTADPGQILTVHGSGFNAGAITSVVFSSSNGYRNEMPATSVTSTDVSVLIPVLFDPVLFQVISGAVSVTVIQKAGGVVKSFGPVTGLQINNLPPVGTAPGVITQTVLTEMQAKLDDTLADWERIQTASQGTTNATALLANLTQMKQAMHNQELSIQKVMSGQVQSISLGNVNGRNVSIDNNALTLMDRIYVAYLLNTPINLRPVSSNKKEEAGGSTRDYVSPQAVNDLPQQIATVIAGLVASTPGNTLESGRRIRSISNGLTDSGTTAAIMLTGAPTVPASTGPLMAAMIWNSTTWSPLAISATLRSIDLQMESRVATVDDFHNEGTFAAASAVDGAALITNGLKPMDQLTADGLTMSAVKTQVSKIPVHFTFTNPASVGSQVQTNFTTIVENLPTRQAAITVGDNGSAADDAFRVLLDGVIIGETAIGATNTIQVNGISQGAHTLTVVCTVAPDGDGTLGLSLGQGLTFSDGTTTRSEDMFEGQSINYSIIAP